MAVFAVLWPYLLTTKLSCLHKNNFGHTMARSMMTLNFQLMEQTLLQGMAIPVVEFSREGYKIRNVFG
jgi:hypothetical protein